LDALPASPLEWSALALSYLLGSVPFGLLLGLALKGVDIRRHGSRNIGATNAGRVLGRPFGLAAFGLDFGKGWAATAWIGPWAAPGTIGGAGDPAAGSPGHAAALAVLCGACAVLGHVFPLFLRFRGGKGVATGCGGIVGMDPWIFLGGGAVWLVTLGLTRFVGLSSMAMALGFVATAVFRARQGADGPELVAGTVGLFLLVLWRHRANIARMAAGTEPRIGRRSRAPGGGPGTRA